MDKLSLNYSNENLFELFAILKDSSTSALITEYNGNIVYANKVFEERTGYSLNEIKGKNPRFLKSEESDPGKHKKLWETITNGREWKGEFKNRRKNGELYWEYSTIYPIKDHNNKITNFLAIKEDIAQIKLLEGLLKVSSEQINQKGLVIEFLKLISNEISIPL